MTASYFFLYDDLPPQPLNHPVRSELSVLIELLYVKMIHFCKEFSYY